MKKSLFDKSVVILLLILNALFFVYWVELSIHYCLHFDDVHFMWKLSNISIFEYVREMYLSRGGNFIGYGINGVIFTVSNLFGLYQFWPILFYIIGILITFLAFKDYVCSINKCKLLLGIITSYNLYILTSVDLAVFTWLCAMAYYLYAPSLCLLLKYINSRRLTITQRIMSVILALFIAGSSVSFSTISFVVLFVNGMVVWYKHDWNVNATWNDNSARNLLFITGIMLVVFAIVVVAPGNYNRMRDGVDIEQPSDFYEFVVACIKCIVMYLYLTVFYLPYYIIVFVFGYYIGTNKIDKLDSKKTKTILIWCTYFLYLLICVMPLAYLSNGFHIQRNYTQLTYFLLISIFITGFIWGTGRRFENSLMITESLSVIFLIIIMTINIHQDIPVAISYYKAHKEREVVLSRYNEIGNTDTIVVKPFPPTNTPDAKYNVCRLFKRHTSMPSMYYESDTGVEPNEYETYIKRIYSLNFDFVIPTINE